MTPEDRRRAQEIGRSIEIGPGQLRQIRGALFPSNVQFQPKLNPCDNCGQPSDVSPDGGLCVGCEAAL
jgi:hypothetical protein